LSIPFGYCLAVALFDDAKRHLLREELIFPGAEVETGELLRAQPAFDEVFDGVMEQICDYEVWSVTDAKILLTFTHEPYRTTEHVDV
jgi:hypothetical protein